ncbi:MAG: hypothetical protein AB8B73_11205, partial [Ekhidna sp.]
NSDGKKSVALTFKTAIGTVICNVKSKTYRKAVKTSEEFDTWIAAISGKDLSTESGVITMSGCGIPVFDKKPKADNKEETKEPQQTPIEEREPKVTATEKVKPKQTTVTREHKIGGKRVFVPEPVRRQTKKRKPEQPHS